MKKWIKWGVLLLVLLLGYLYLRAQGLHENKYVALSVNGDPIAFSEIDAKVAESEKAAARAQKKDPAVSQEALDAILLTNEEATRLLIEERIMLQEADKLRIFASEAAARDAAQADFAQLLQHVQEGSATDEEADRYEEIRVYMESKKFPIERYPDLAYVLYQEELTRENLRKYFNKHLCDDPEKEEEEFAAYIQELIDNAQVVYAK